MLFALQYESATPKNTNWDDFSLLGFAIPKQPRQIIMLNQMPELGNDQIDYAFQLGAISRGWSINLQRKFAGSLCDCLTQRFDRSLVLRKVVASEMLAEHIIKEALEALC